MTPDGYKTDAEEITDLLGGDPNDPFIRAVQAAGKLTAVELARVRRHADYLDAIHECQRRAWDLHEAFLHDSETGRAWLTAQVEDADRHLARVFVRLANDLRPPDHGDQYTAMRDLIRQHREDGEQTPTVHAAMLRAINAAQDAGEPVPSYMKLLTDAREHQ